MSKTIRRDLLRKAVEAGKIVMVESYHFDDMTGQDHRQGLCIPCAIAPSDWHDRKEGVAYLYRSDFDSSCGYCTMNDDGTINLGVHGNCHYTLKLKEGCTLTNGAVVKRATAHRPENARMQAFLAAHGIEAVPKYLPDGSMKGCWRLYNRAIPWSMDLANKLNALGFTDYNFKPLGKFSGNGGMFSCFVRGHNDLLVDSEPRMIED